MLERERHPDQEEPIMGTRGGPSGRPETGTGDNVVDMARERGGNVKDDVQEKTSELIDQARHQAKSSLSGQMNVAADSLGTVASALRQTGNQLRSQDQQGIAGYADKTAEQIDRLSGYLRDNNVEDALREVEGVARRQPLLFLGGAFVAGILGARFLKSSSPPRETALDYRRPELQRGYYGQPPSGGRFGYGGQATTGTYPPRGVPTTPETKTGLGSTSETGGSGARLPVPPVKHTERPDEAA